MKEIKQLLGISDQKYLNEIIQVSKNYFIFINGKILIYKMIFQIISNIRQKMPEEYLQLLFNLKKQNNDYKDLKEEPFGKKIPYHELEISWPETDILQDSKTLSIAFDDLMRVPLTETTVAKKNEVILFKI